MSKIAKFAKSFSSKGVLSVSDMKITEIKKDELNVVDFQNILHQFEGEEISITIKHEQDYSEEDTE